MNIKNLEIRIAAREKEVCLWRIAQALRISECTLTRRLRHELPEAEQKQILAIINQIADEKGA